MKDDVRRVFARLIHGGSWCTRQTGMWSAGVARTGVSHVCEGDRGVRLARRTS